MKSFLLLCLLSCLLAFQSCKQTPAEQQEETVAISGEATNNDASVADPEGHDYNFLTDKMLHYKAANTAGKDAAENAYANQWIDLDPDGTYKSGVLSEQTHTGKWTYNHEAGVLHLRPDDNKFKMSEWNVMHNNNIIVFVGTQTYGNNATQIKLERSDKFPE